MRAYQNNIVDLVKRIVDLWKNWCVYLSSSLTDKHALVIQRPAISLLKAWVNPVWNYVYSLKGPIEHSAVEQNEVVY